MNVDDEIDRRLLRNARELRGVPIEPPPLYPRRTPRSGVRSVMLATCAVLVAVGGGIAIWDEVAPPAGSDPVVDEFAVADGSVIDASEVAAEPAASRQLLDGYDEVAMIGQVADRFAAAAEHRPPPPGVV